jgi:hypothetical protein
MNVIEQEAAKNMKKNSLQAADRVSWSPLDRLPCKKQVALGNSSIESAINIMGARWFSRL